MATNNKIKLRDLDDDVVQDIASKISSGSISNYNDTALKNRISSVEAEISRLNSDKFDKYSDKFD